MSEDQLIQAIEETMIAAHRKCQPWLAKLAELWFRGRLPPTVTETYVTSKPIGGNAVIRSVGFSIEPGGK